MKSISVILLGLFTVCFTFSTPAYAAVDATTNPGASGYTQNESTTRLQNPLGDKIPDIPTLITKIIDIVIQFSYIVVACFLIWSGFKFVTAQGNESKISSAKSTFYWTIVGALIVMGAQTLSAMFKATLENLGK
jgi:hypothetical protein